MLTFQEALVKGYAVMDANAFGLCKENKLPIVVSTSTSPARRPGSAGERVARCPMTLRQRFLH